MSQWRAERDDPIWKKSTPEYRRAYRESRHRKRIFYNSVLMDPTFRKVISVQQDIDRAMDLLGLMDRLNYMGADPEAPSPRALATRWKAQATERQTIGAQLTGISQRVTGHYASQCKALATRIAGDPLALKGAELVGMLVDLDAVSTCGGTGKREGEWSGWYIRMIDQHVPPMSNRFSVIAQLLKLVGIVRTAANVRSVLKRGHT
ncbi:MAG: hypothetical protein ACRETA_01145 [Gammaproteobacteria bacterium]